MKTTGHYYRSRKEYEQRTGKSSKYIQNNPCIHISGSVREWQRKRNAKTLLGLQM